MNGDLFHDAFVVAFGCFLAKAIQVFCLTAMSVYRAWKQIKSEKQTGGVI